MLCEVSVCCPVCSSCPLLAGTGCSSGRKKKKKNDNNNNNNDKNENENDNENDNIIINGCSQGEGSPS